MRSFKLLIIIFLISFTSLSCAYNKSELLKKDIKRYAKIEKELNIKIKQINDEMVYSITKAKKTGDMKTFKKDNILIENQLKQLLKLSKEVEKYIKTKEVKKYHKYTTKSLKIQSEYVKENIKQFKSKGEHSKKNNAKLTQITYGKKIKKIQKQQTEYLKKIIKKMRNK